MSKLIGLPEFCNVNPTIKHNDIQFPHTQALNITGIFWYYRFNETSDNRVTIS